MMKRIAVLLAVMLGLAGTVVAQSATAASKSGDETIVAMINGEPLTRQAFDHMWNGLSPDMQKRYQASGGRMQFLDNYIRKRLVIQQAITEGFDKHDDIELSINEARESAIFDHYLREVVAAKVVPEEKVRQYYDEHNEELRRPELLKARHILVTPDDKPVTNSAADNAKSDAEAQAKIARLEDELRGHPELFEEAARQYSEDTTTSASGGELGWFQKGRMVPDFEKAALGLEPGTMSGIVKTPYGYHLILLEERRESSVPSYEEMRDSIREDLVKERMRDVMSAVESLTNDLRERADVTVNKDAM